MVETSLRSGYEALERGDTKPLLALLGADVEWVEPDGTATEGLEAAAAALAAGQYVLGEVLFAGDRKRCIATGILRRDGFELPFVHVWELGHEWAVRVRTYFDRSRISAAAQRQQLTEAADELLEQAAEIRRQWARLGDALRAAGLEEAVAELPGGAAGTTSARLAAVDMASDGSSREEVEAFLRDELGVEEPGPILDEVFRADDAPSPDQAETEPDPGAGPPRFSRLFARDRG